MTTLMMKFLTAESTGPFQHHYTSCIPTLMDALGIPKLERSMDFAAVGKENVGEVKGVIFEGKREIASGGP
jgi:hypothetical protein